MLLFCSLLLFGQAVWSAKPAPKAGIPHLHYERDILLADDHHLSKRQFPNSSLVSQVFEVTHQSWNKMGRLLEPEDQFHSPVSRRPWTQAQPRNAR